MRASSSPAVPDSVEPKLRYPVYSPPMPRALEELNISHSLVTDLMLRHVRARGTSSFSSLTGSMKVSTSIIRVLFEQMRKQQLVEVKGMTGQDYLFDLTAAGRNLAAERSQVCTYTGPAPVSLAGSAPRYAPV